MCLTRYGKGNASLVCIGPKQRPSSVIFATKPSNALHQSSPSASSSSSVSKSHSNNHPLFSPPSTSFPSFSSSAPPPQQPQPHHQLPQTASASSSPSTERSDPNDGDENNICVSPNDRNNSNNNYNNNCRNLNNYFSTNRSTNNYNYNCCNGNCDNNDSAEAVPRRGKRVNQNNRKKENYNDPQNNISLCCNNQNIENDPIIDAEVPIPIASTARERSANTLLDIEIKETPPLPNFKDKTFNEIFLAKVKVCRFLLQFNSSVLQYRQKQIKLNTLIDIQNFFDRSTTDARNLCHALQDELFDMMQENLFQHDPFLATKKFDSNFPNDVINPAWPHLSVIYSILNRFIAVFPNYRRLDFEFAKKIIRFMNSPDINERVRLSSFLKSYFQIHPSDFSLILAVIQNQLIDIICRVSIPYCAVPMLSFLSSILATVSVPISEDVIKLIRNSVIPLIISPDFNLFQSSLFHFFEVALTSQHQELLKDALRYLFYCWPRNCGTKQPGFIQLMILVFGRINTKAETIALTRRMFLFFAQSVRSPNEKTSEATLKMWSGQRVDPVVQSNPKVAMITMYDAVLWASTEHWSANVRSQATNSLAQMKKLNLNTYLQLRKCQKEKFSGRSSSSSSSYQQQIMFQPQQNQQNQQQQPQQQQQQQQQSNQIVQNSQTMQKPLGASAFLRSWAMVTHAAAEIDDQIDVLKALKQVQVEFAKIQSMEVNVPTLNEHDLDFVTVGGNSKLPMLKIIK